MIIFRDIVAVITRCGNYILLYVCGLNSSPVANGGRADAAITATEVGGWLGT